MGSENTTTERLKGLEQTGVFLKSPSPFSDSPIRIYDVEGLSKSERIAFLQFLLRNKKK